MDHDYKQRKATREAAQAALAGQRPPKLVGECWSFDASTPPIEKPGVG